MKHIIVLVLVVSSLMACKQESKTADVAATEDSQMEQEIAYKSFGKEIDANNAMDTKKMTEAYQSMTVGDSIDAKVVAKVNEVCQAKGCWMKLDLENGEQAMVKFKDYGFFMPKDIAGKDVIINGKAYVNVVPVDEQRHYAEDGGASKEEIALITAPKKTFSFEADGVLLKSI